MIQAIIFDMDGVLIEAKDWHYEALNHALRACGFEISRQDHLTIYDGLPTSKKLDMLTKKCGLPAELHHSINQMKQVYTMELVQMHCRPYATHQYALSRLKAENYKLGVASNSIRHTVETMMQKSQLIDYFDVILSSEDVARPKPDPEIYQQAMQKLGFKPHECLVIEDNENGIRAAKTAGAHVLVVREIDEVNYNNITQYIAKINGKIYA